VLGEPGEHALGAATVVGTTGTSEYGKIRHGSQLLCDQGPVVLL
jgi:hypothetical protein